MATNNAASSQNVSWILQYQWEQGTRESVSGYGSSMKNTREIRAALPIIFSTYSIKSMIDMPCGDWNWMQHVDLTGIDYLGLDIVPDMIAHHDGSFDQRFKVHDAVVDSLPYADMLLCRDFLFHIPFKQGMQVMQHIRDAGIKYLLATTFPDAPVYDVIEDACIRWRKVDMMSEPYNLPDPLYVVQENNSSACQGRQVCLWSLKDI